MNYVYILGDIWIIALMISTIIFVLHIVAQWWLFGKAHEQGWKALIPFYSTYTQFHLFWTDNMFYVWLAIFLLSGMSFPFAPLVSAVISVASVIMSLMLMIRTAEAFGKTGGFVIGMVFLSLIFELILAFDSSVYLGPSTFTHGVLVENHHYHHHSGGSNNYNRQARLPSAASAYPRIILTESGSGITYHADLRRTLVVGRGSNASICLRSTGDDLISREHALVAFRDNRVLIKDISSNGTWINGNAVHSAAELRNGDNLTLGRTKFHVSIQ